MSVHVDKHVIIGSTVRTAEHYWRMHVEDFRGRVQVVPYSRAASAIRALDAISMWVEVWLLPRSPRTVCQEGFAEALGAFKCAGGVVVNVHKDTP